MGVSSGDYRVVSRAALVLCEWMSRFGMDGWCGGAGRFDFKVKL